MYLRGACDVQIPVNCVGRYLGSGTIIPLDEVMVTFLEAVTIIGFGKVGTAGTSDCWTRTRRTIYIQMKSVGICKV
jgi:hypothetical protein